MVAENTMTTDDGSKVDQLVATYAELGRQEKLKRVRKQGIYAAGFIIVLGAALLLSQAHLSPEPQNPASFSDPATAARIDALLREREQFETRIDQLEQQIVALAARKDDIENQKARLAAQAVELDAEQQQESLLDQEIAALAQQREALEKRWAQFEAQGELLVTEIIAVNAQRKELEAQRREIDRHRKELEEMLERASSLYPRDASSAGVGEDVTTAVGQEDFGITYESLIVDNTLLEDMRGGFSIGEGLDVSFGFTQTGSINGVEQFRNNFTVDNMAEGFVDVNMSNMNPVLLQNGSGNFVSANVLDAMSEGFSNIVQNTLDDQVISTTTVLDISLSNVPGALQGLAGEQAVLDALGAF